MKTKLSNILPYILVIVGFIVISVSYFLPVLEGKKILQSDIVQYIGMAKQQIDFRENTGEEMYWTDRAFGGMPTYQSGALYPNNYIKKIDRLIRFLPRPADYLFLYFIGFFVLLKCFKVDNLLAFFGSLAFGFSTYFIIIIGVGHNAKAHAIGYMPLVLSGILLVYNNKYIKGGLLFSFAMALELVANHFQMTYYLGLLSAIVAAVYLIEAVKQKTISNFLQASGVLVIGLFLALALNATSILATKEYSDFSTRGTSEISISPKGEVLQRKGLDKDYILSYSYGFLESFNLAIPRFMGGSSSEDAGEDASIINELVQLGYPYNEAKNVAKSAPTYWGEQPYVGAPAYIGIGVIFLFVLGLFTVKSKKKWWIVIASTLALMLSWGKNMEWFSELFINYFPLYNKFRAVTSIQVIIELCLPILAIWTIHKFVSQEEIEDDNKLENLYKSVGIVGGLLVLFVLFKNTLFSFSSPNDAQIIKSAGMRFVTALREDRARMFTSDTLRGLFFVSAIAGSLWLFLKQKISKQITVISIGVLLVVDLVLVDKRYVTNDDFVSAKQMDQPYVATAADKKIQEDTSHFRVYDLTGNPFNTARTSYFHNAVGGYHGAKPSRIQDLADFYIDQGYQPVLDMLNVKYFIFDGEQGAQIQQNKTAFGNAWFVNNIVLVDSANDEILALKSENLNKSAIVNRANEISKKVFQVDSLSKIELIKHKPNRQLFKSNNSNDAFAVFSEMYYKKGWKAYIDGSETAIIKTNYALRGIEVPKGKHEIVFEFKPEVIKTGSTITLIAFIVLLGLFIAAVVYWNKKDK